MPEPIRPEPVRPVVVVDFNIRFWSLVWFFVKAAFASIPAMIIVVAIGSMAVGWAGVMGRLFSSIGKSKTEQYDELIKLTQEGDRVKMVNQTSRAVTCTFMPGGALLRWDPQETKEVGTADRAYLLDCKIGGR